MRMDFHKAHLAILLPEVYRKKDRERERERERKSGTGHPAVQNGKDFQCSL